MSLLVFNPDPCQNNNIRRRTISTMVSSASTQRHKESATSSPTSPGKVQDAKPRPQEPQSTNTLTAGRKAGGAPQLNNDPRSKGTRPPKTPPPSSATTNPDRIAVPAPAHAGLRILLHQTGHGRVRRRHRPAARRARFQRAVRAGADPGAETGLGGVQRGGEGEGDERGVGDGGRVPGSGSTC